MSKSMLVNVTAEEENRVAIVDNGVLDLFEIETLSRENLKGNIFKVIVEGVNPALEAAFVNYGAQRAGFLPLDEVNFKLYPSRNGGSGGKGRGGRIARHLDKGMEVLVQVIRDSFANKPPTMSTYYSLPGRYLVLMPGADAAGISRKIEDSDQRDRLRRLLDELTVPEGYGVIIRTAGLETTPRDLQADLDSLLELWRSIDSASKQVKAPALIFQERDLVVRTIRDYFTSDIEEVLIDDEAAYLRARKYFEAHMPDHAGLVRLYTGDKPIFTKYNLEDQIERIYKRTVQLKSGGLIAIDQTEALTAIDVNSARSSRSANSEETALRTNLEAAEEIARQLRLRDIGGLIVVDFIDMESPKHIRQVERCFAEAMGRDKARYDITRISKLGLMEVSRQRIKATKASSSFRECPTCQGDGNVRTPESAARMAFRKIQARVVKGDIAGVKVFLPPEVALHLLNQKRDDLTRLETRYRVQVEVEPEERMQASQFEIEEIRREESEIMPMVTAETVDQALVSGALPSVSRAPEPAAAATAGDTEGRPGETGDRQARRRRRRRRGRRAEAPGSPATTGEDETRTRAAAASRGGVTPDEGGSREELPAYAAGPDEEPGGGNGDGGEPDSARLPHLAELPGGETPAQGAHARRRRRRRRGRGRHHGGAQRLQGAASDSGPPPAATKAGGGDGGARESRAVSPPRLHEDGARVSGDEPAGRRQAEPKESPSAAEPPAGEPAVKKPKRRWWIRSFKG